MRFGHMKESKWKKKKKELIEHRNTEAEFWFGFEIEKVPLFSLLFHKFQISHFSSGHLLKNVK